MKKVLGIFGLLAFVVVSTALLNKNFMTAYNIQNIIRWTALFGIISIGVAFVIITGGIDLSIGSVVGLTGVLLAMFLKVSFVASELPFNIADVNVKGGTLLIEGDTSILKHGDKLVVAEPETDSERELTINRMKNADQDEQPAVEAANGQEELRIDENIGWVKSGLKTTALIKTHMSPAAAISLVMLIAIGIGLLHGILITKLKLQPFVVTLCGLLFYRGFSRWVSDDQTQGFGNSFEGLRTLATGKMPITDDFSIPVPCLILIVLAILSSVFLNMTVHGRYLLALGRNEQAARYSGINTDRNVIMAYILCSGMAGLGGILFALDINSIQPSGHGNFYELYAIAAAVLGGCSLRGGEGSILGVVIGAAVMRVLYNAINILGIPTQLEFAIIGLVILAGVIADELVKRIAARQRAIRQARDATAS